MSRGGGGGQPSCASVSFGKYLAKRFTGKPRRRKRPAAGGGEVRVSKELVASSPSLKSSEPVVRVVLQSGVVEAYAGVVLACTVIRNHPPGLCLAYPDVFRNPHGARVRPLEPLFPGQKFFLLTEHTMEWLQRRIPESSVGAFDETREEEVRRDAIEDDATASETTTSEEDTQDCSSAAASSEEDDDRATRSWCCAREYFEAKERWEARQFRQMVARGLAVEEKDRKKETVTNKKKKRGKNSKGKRTNKRGLAGVASTRCSTATAPATARRTWEPSLPSVVEEESSPLQPPSETTSCRI
ncbi:uncharacterized protein LOC121053881 [Oryza brachyantha]|uniref:Uncharacterized protein n=1 Tax=Oryza brachyantha TaxID=4533 RepID=J3LUQ5_ORYBR|nr:uncharacterized protein LOC121053881 [Oryza brachyantha]